MPYADPVKRREYHNVYSKQWRFDNPERTKEIRAKSEEKNKVKRKERRSELYSTTKRWSDQIKNKYGLSVDQYFSILAEQKGVCKICHVLTTEKLAVDHCHNTNRIRGLLCGPCNRGLGMFRDDRYSLQNALDYLTEHMASRTRIDNDDKWGRPYIER